MQDDLELDSMDFLNLVTALHQQLGLDIPETDYPKIATLALAVGYLKGRSADALARKYPIPAISITWPRFSAAQWRAELGTTIGELAIYRWAEVRSRHLELFVFLNNGLDRWH